MALKKKNKGRMGARVNNRTAETRYDLLNLAQCCFLDGPGGGAFAFLFGTTPGHLTDLLVPTPGNLPFFYYKNANARRGGRAGGGGEAWALLPCEQWFPANERTRSSSHSPGTTASRVGHCWNIRCIK